MQRLFTRTDKLSMVGKVEFDRELQRIREDTRTANKDDGFDSL